MRAIYPALDHLGLEPTPRRNFWLASLTAAIAAISSASVMIYLAGYPGRKVEFTATSPVAVVIKDPSAAASSAVIQGQKTVEQTPFAARADDLSKTNNSIAPADVVRQKSMGFESDQPLRDASKVAKHRQIYWRHVFGRFSTPNHW